MNGIFECILKRRSVRAFRDRRVENAELARLLEAAIAAPSGKNAQTWRFTAIQNREQITELDARARAVLHARGETLHGFYRPAVVILASNDRENPNGLADCACALQNIFLAAAAQGLGSCWINGLKTISDEQEIRALLDRWEIPAPHIVWGAAAIGYPESADIPPPPPPPHPAPPNRPPREKQRGRQ